MQSVVCLVKTVRLVRPRLVCPRLVRPRLVRPKPVCRCSCWRICVIKTPARHCVPVSCRPRLPFAAIAGRTQWLDALDGGHWQYGDDSYPEAGVTYFAGTFVRHPLALAAAKATLLHLKQGGKALYQTLADRTQYIVDRLNEGFAVVGIDGLKIEPLPRQLVGDAETPPEPIRPIRRRGPGPGGASRSRTGRATNSPLKSGTTSCHLRE